MHTQASCHYIHMAMYMCMHIQCTCKCMCTYIYCTICVHVHVYTVYVHVYVCMYRRIDQLEMSIAAEKEPPATLPITEGSRASSHSSLDGIVTPSAAAVVTAHHSNSTAHPTSTTTGLGTGMGTGMGAGAVASHVMTGSTLTQNNSTPLVPVVQHQTLLSDDEVRYVMYSVIHFMPGGQPHVATEYVTCSEKRDHLQKL